MTIDEMFVTMDSFVHKKCGAGATLQEIAQAEQELGVRFPNSYKAFLARFGWAEIAYDYLYGLGADVPNGYTLVKNALNERHEAQPHLPPHFVPIMNDGAGNNYCLDTSRLQDGECPVIFWDHEHEDGSDQSPEQQAASFSEWLIDRIQYGPYSYTERLNHPILRLDDDHPAKTFLIAFMDCRSDCAGREIPFPGRAAIDQAWTSATDGRTWTFSGFMYCYICFDIVLDGYLQDVPHLTLSEIGAAEELPKFRTMMNECTEAARRNCNSEILSLIDQVLEMLDLWEGYLAYRQQMVSQDRG